MSDTQHNQLEQNAESYSYEDINGDDRLANHNGSLPNLSSDDIDTNHHDEDSIGVSASETVIDAALLNQQYLNYTYGNSVSDPSGSASQYWSNDDNHAEQYTAWNGGSAENSDQISPYFTGFATYVPPDAAQGTSALVGSPFEAHAYSPVDFQPTYLGGAGAHFAAASYPLSPVDFAAPWASAPGTAFDFNAMQAYSPADQMKILEHNFNNLNFFGAPLHDFSGYQALLSNQSAKQKSYASIAGQSNQGNSAPGSSKGYRTGKAGSPLAQPFYGAPSNNGFASPALMTQVLDIGTWDKSGEISPSNKVLTRSGKMVPTPSEKENEVLRKLRMQNNYNPAEFNCSPKDGRFFVIKSYSEDDIHRSIKYNLWCSTERGNRKLNAAFNQMQGKGPVYLLYSVNGSGHFCGLAEMKSNVDYETQETFWAQSKWKGSFKVQWIFVKDVPNSQFRHIRLENNENKPVTNSRDTQEIPFEKGKMMLKIFHSFDHATSLFDDFSHYESRENEVADEEPPCLPLVS